MIQNSPVDTNPQHNVALFSPTIRRAPEERTWLDRVLDAVVGEAEGPQNKFALICEQCFTHNGLVLPHEYMEASKPQKSHFRIQVL